jgi:hypothetical protein
MPKPKHTIENKYINSLRNELQSTLGMTVKNRPDTEKFSVLIRHIHDLYISASTITRLFLNAESNHHFYLDTLDKLASIINKNYNWEAFCLSCDESSKQLRKIGAFEENNFGTNLIALNFKHTSWKPLHDLFENLSSANNEFRTYRFMHEFGFQFYAILNLFPQTEIQFYKLFSKYSIIRNSFFEFNADPDFLLPNYNLGIEYYIKNIDYNDSNAINDLLFAKCLHFYSALNKLDIQEMNRKIHELKSCISSDKLLSTGIHPFNCGRYLASIVYNSYYNRINQFDNEIDSAINWFQVYSPQIDSYAKRVISFHLLEAFYTLKVNESRFQFILNQLPILDEMKGKPAPEFMREVLWNIEPSGIRWKRRFKM